MKKQIYIVTLILFGLLSCVQKQTKDKIESNQSRIFHYDNQPYLIKGICYHPVPKGSDQRSFETIDQDLELMVEAGINTIRVYEPIDDTVVLDKINSAGLKVIIGFGYNQNGNYDILSGSFIDYVKKYKDHPSILMWELGNEYNYHPEWFDDDIANWYKALNESTDLIHKVDKKHKVTTAHGELPDELALKMTDNIDVWGLNIYRWDNPSELFEQWEKVSDKPMYLSEAGGDSYMTITKQGYEKGLNEKAQAGANAKILESVFNNKEVCFGVTMFSFTDGWWKAGNINTQDIGGWAPNSSGVPYDGTPNEEFWGIVDIDRNKKETYVVIKNKYRQTLTEY
ncbi:glycoside hydrolase family 2 TIM barrel-domain containing protein [Urechidicola vernalis]|uniref:Glycoside hydrolase family 2 TIM barrel-domain containing protein n=1 Tax=Urechidicola vernalis TaxID=3075600 RepID=A0ABU2Y6J5_9FLAO|nr:glycoside hydrolase family 2 TIM barrel-domain containing protein [Urechidicola sp. P050]MDT0553436.1 glycoside hydrolase family 2 TIM barrel-domain containing protein [Urechidicola sp. P050]